MPSGGKRAGAGKPKGYKASHTLEAELYRKELIKQIVENKKPLARALVKKGLKGDVPALKEINERALGKVRDMVDITSKGKPIALLGNTRHKE